MAAITSAADAPGFNFSVLTKGTQVAGYTTGSGGVRWTDAMWKAFPTAVRICQDPAASDVTADVLDVEDHAATTAVAPGWVKAARQAWQGNARPGQREPAIYCSAFMITPVVNALQAAGVKRCPLWVAHFGIGMGAATQMLNDSSGPYPVIGVQYQNHPSFDSDLFLTSWLENVSGKAVTVTAQAPPGQWDDPGFWTWKDAAIVGTGLDGQLHLFTFDPKAGTWQKAE